MRAGGRVRTVWNLTGSVSSSVGSMCAQDLLAALMPYRNTLQTRSGRTQQHKTAHSNSNNNWTSQGEQTVRVPVCAPSAAGVLVQALSSGSKPAAPRVKTLGGS